MENLNKSEFNLTEYLRIAQELESSVYRQEKAIEEINNRIEQNNSYLVSNAEIKRRDKIVAELNGLKNKDKKYIGPYSPDYVSSPVEISKLDSSGQKAAIMTLFISVIGCMITLATLEEETAGLFVFFFVVFIIALLIYIVLKVTEKVQIKIINKDNWTNYERKKKIAEEKYNREKAAAEKEHYDLIIQKQREVAKAENRVESIKQDGELKNEIAYQEKKLLDETLSKTKQTLDQLYAIDIVYPKYRNMAAMCTMYEYFVTGRCNRLDGPDGAYNLYETEIRQNIIIVSLAKIIEQLEEIKERQYQLYQELKITNKMLNGVGSELNSIYNSTKSIEQITESIERNSYISSQCTEIMSKNVNALKYISLINTSHNW